MTFGLHCSQSRQLARDSILPEWAGERDGFEEYNEVEAHIGDLFLDLIVILCSNLVPPTGVEERQQIME